MPVYKIYLLLIILFSPSVSYAQEDYSTGTKQETLGFSLGAILGGLIAGPPGAIIGATGGILFGHRNAEIKNKIALMKDEILKKDIAIADLSQRLSDQEVKNLNTLHPAGFENKQSLLNKLKSELSYTVYFRTDQVEINEEDRQYLNKLSKLIMNIPEISVLLHAHTDPRGTIIYNRKLSQERAEKVAAELIQSGIKAHRIHQHAYGEAKAKSRSGDLEGYYFDRKVVINLTTNVRT